jgi:hypothetical protein
LLIFSHGALSLPGDGELVATPYIKGTKYTDSSADTKAYTAYDTKAKTYRHMNFFEQNPTNKILNSDQNF